MTIIEFLLARIAEDEGRADDASYLNLDDDPGGVGGCAYVLRECEAKREIIEHATGQHTGGIEFEPILQALAAVYADHPDYDPSWAHPGI